jgi:hypothetical protein
LPSFAPQRMTSHTRSFVKYPLWAGPGDSITYEYTLTATGTTLGGEHGYLAFIGDPFGLDVFAGNLVPSLTPVPEPQSGALTLCGVAWLAGWRRQRTRVRAEGVRCPLER